VIQVRGIDPVLIRGLARNGFEFWASSATVDGQWDGNVLTVATVEVHEQPIRRLAGNPPPELAPVPCSAPPGGWPTGPKNDPSELAIAAVGNVVVAHPDEYAGFWLVTTPTGARVLVVSGVSVDGANKTRITGVYRHPLCMVHVTHSLTELNRIAAELSARPPWQAEVVPELDIVRLFVGIADGAALSAVSGYGDAVQLVPVATTG
jgi:hypothetical protein